MSALKNKLPIYRLFKIKFTFLISIYFLTLFGCQKQSVIESGPIRVVLDRPPITLNPRRALGAYSQRIGSLLFEGLTRINKNLIATPGLASKWASTNNKKNWTFTIRKNLHDHFQNPITPEDIFKCLENYRTTNATVTAFIPNWLSTKLNNKKIEIELSKSDPYLHKNISLIKYFTIRGMKDQPCYEPKEGDQVVGSGPFYPKNKVLTNLYPELALTVFPNDNDKSALKFLFIRDESTRVLKLLKGEADVAQNSISLTKTKWLEDSKRNDFYVLKREGVNVSYLAFNLSDNILSNKLVRRAISMSIDKQEIINNKMFGYGAAASSFISPAITQTSKPAFNFNISAANKLLDLAGYKKDNSGTRFSLKYKTTPRREGIEQGLVVKEMVKKIGIVVNINVVEPAVFFASINKRNFQMYSSRWIGISDPSILYSTLYSNHERNRASYSDKNMDSLLNQAMSEEDSSKRASLFLSAQKKMLDDLPYFPLWYWKNAIIIRRGLSGLSGNDLSLSGGFEPISLLKRKHNL